MSLNSFSTDSYVMLSTTSREFERIKFKLNDQSLEWLKENSSEGKIFMGDTVKASISCKYVRFKYVHTIEAISSV